MPLWSLLAIQLDLSGGGGRIQGCKINLDMGSLDQTLNQRKDTNCSINWPVLYLGRRSIPGAIHPDWTLILLKDLCHPPPSNSEKLFMNLSIIFSQVVSESRQQILK